MIKVGVYMKRGKWDKMKMDKICSDAIGENISIELLELSENMQKKCDLVIHKSIDLFVQSNVFNSEMAAKMLSNFRSYLKRNGEIVVVNSLDFDFLVTSRKKTFEKLLEINFMGCCSVPTVEMNTKKLIIKPDLACGSDFAHKFQIVNKLDIDNNDNGVYIQPFIETDDAVLKVYVIGEVTRYVLKNPNNIDINIENNVVEKIARLISEKLSCELFGFDLIQDIHDKKWYLIDVNSFSGMEILPDFENLFFNFIKSKLNKI